MYDFKTHLVDNMFLQAKWFRLFLTNTNNSIYYYERYIVLHVNIKMRARNSDKIKHQSLVYTVEWSHSSYLNNSVYHVKKVKWLQVLLCIINNSVKQS